MLYYDTNITAVLAGINPFLTKTSHSKQKKIHYSTKRYDILIKPKVSEGWAWSILTPFLCKLGPKIAILQGFTNFFQNYRNKFINTN